MVKTLKDAQDQVADRRIGVTSSRLGSPDPRETNRDQMAH